MESLSDRPRIPAVGATGSALPTINGYEVVEIIGRGGFSAVYRAVQLSMDRPVALKVLDAWDPDPEDERRFRIECRSVGALSWHPHIVAVFDAGMTDDDRPFMSMELLDDGSLAQAMRRNGPLPTDEVVRVGREMCDALGAAHEVGIVHRDVKPANVLIGRRREFVLSDFGIAAFNDSTRSSTGSFSGTLAFTAPEVLLGERATVRSDVFSLGVSLHSLLMGTNSFAAEGTSPGVVIQRVLNNRLPDLPASVPIWLADVIEKACAKDPGQRFATTDEFARALAPTTSERSVSTPPPPPAGPTDAADPADDATVAHTTPPVVPPTHDGPTAISSEDDVAESSPHQGNRRRRVMLAVLALIILAVGGGALLKVNQPSEPVVPQLGPATPSRLIDADVGTIAVQQSEVGVVAPGTATVTALSSYSEIDTSESFTDLPLVAAARGSLWVLVRSGDSTSELVQIDPATDTIVRRQEVQISSPKFLVAGDGALWSNSTGAGPGFVLQIARIDLDDLTVQVIDEGTVGGLADLAATDGSRLWVKVTRPNEGGSTIGSFEFTEWNTVTDPLPSDPNGGTRGSWSTGLPADAVQEMVATDGGLLMVLVEDDGVALRHSSVGPDGDLVPLPLDGVDDVAVGDGSTWALGYRGNERVLLRLDALFQVAGSMAVDDVAAAVVGVDQTTARVLSPDRRELLEVTF